MSNLVYTIISKEKYSTFKYCI